MEKSLVKLTPVQNGCRFADDVIKCILLNENRFSYYNSNFNKIHNCRYIIIRSANGLVPNREQPTNYE